MPSRLTPAHLVFERCVDLSRGRGLATPVGVTVTGLCRIIVLDLLRWHALHKKTSKGTPRDQEVPFVHEREQTCATV